MSEQEQKKINQEFLSAVAEMEGDVGELVSLKKIIQKGVDAHAINEAICNVLKSSWTVQALRDLLSFFIQQSADINAIISKDQNFAPLLCIVRTHKLKPQEKKEILELFLKKGADVRTNYHLSAKELLALGGNKDSLSLIELINLTKNKNIVFPDVANSDYLIAFNIGLELFLDNPAKFKSIKVGDDVLTVDFFQEHMKNAVNSKTYNPERIAQYEKYQKQKALEKAQDNEFTDVFIFTGEQKK
jgi:hypothetical protein